jgi:tRNA(Ile)-lysidine synthase
LRNRVRHDLLPLLEREFNPNIRAALSGVAEIARGEEAFWQELISPELRERASGQKREVEDGPGPDSRQELARLRLTGFAELPLGVQRRLLKRFAEDCGLGLDFEHIERLRSCVAGQLPKVELPGGIFASIADFVLTLRRAEASSGRAYSYVLPVPGEVAISEAGLRVRAFIVRPEFAEEAEPGTLLSLDLIGPQLIVRNWSPGDRFWPAHSRSEEKLKRLFLEKKVPAGERPKWPVALCDDRIIWVRGFPVANTHRWRGTGEALQIEVLEDRAKRKPPAAPD